MEKRALEPQKSEVARILTEIGYEYEMADQLRRGFMLGGCQHVFMTARTENISRLHKALEQIVGERAPALVADHLDTI